MDPLKWACGPPENLRPHLENRCPIASQAAEIEWQGLPC